MCVLILNSFGAVLSVHFFSFHSFRRSFTHSHIHIHTHRLSFSHLKCEQNEIISSFFFSIQEENDNLQLYDALWWPDVICHNVSYLEMGKFFFRVCFILSIKRHVKSGLLWCYQTIYLQMKTYKIQKIIH